jgi:hypothetical protein
MLSIPPPLPLFGKPIAPPKPVFFEVVRLAHWQVADAHATWA